MTRELLNDMFDQRHRFEAQLKHVENRSHKDRLYRALRSIEQCLCEMVDDQEKEEAWAKKIDLSTLQD